MAEEKKKDIVIKWFRADKNNYIQNFQQFTAFELKIDINYFKGNEEAYLTSVKTVIKNLKYKLLFVLDNVDSYEAISKYVDAVTENVKYLITTITQQYPKFYEKIELKMFATKDIETYLESHFEELLLKMLFS
jgi:hypothetical protein